MTRKEPHSSSAQYISNVGVGEQSSSGEVTLWLTQKFAELWFLDAKREAADYSFDARRREIIFAVATVESYLLEWVLEMVGPQKLDDYLPALDRRGIKERWKEVVKKLYENTQIQGLPNFSTSPPWQNFLKMADFRNGLLHARSGRPDTTGRSACNQPMPTIGELKQLKPGAACAVVKALIEENAQITETELPRWLASP